MKIVYLKLSILHVKNVLFLAVLVAALIYIAVIYYNIYSKVIDKDITIENTIKICDRLKNLPTINGHNIISGPPQKLNDSPFSVYYNHLEATNDYKSNATVTYGTHVTPKFIANIKELVIAWDGPISISVYVPATDMCLAVERILFLRNCDSPKIKEIVTWHFYWPKSAPPFFNIRKKFIESQYSCSTVPDFTLQTWRVLNNYSYPINVGRNIARQGAKTLYILPSDIELIPSQNLASFFVKYVFNEKSAHFNALSSIKKVFVVPVFETKNIIPKTKRELILQLLNGSSVYFHRYICRHCQRFPKFEKWVTHGDINKVKEFAVVQRHFPYHRWEPIFICTNNEPLYDEELTWEGLQDKMAQMHELCLLNYYFIILDGAFLVHLPGIKRQKLERNGWRDVFMESNTYRYNTIMMELEAKYGFKVECRKH